MPVAGVQVETFHGLVNDSPTSVKHADDAFNACQSPKQPTGVAVQDCAHLPVIAQRPLPGHVKSLVSSTPAASHGTFHFSDPQRHCGP